MIREEGHYTLKRVDSLPKKGNANFLYILKGTVDNYYRWMANGTYETIPVGASGGGSDDQDASEVPYDNGTSGLTAADVQGALDEIVASGGSGISNTSQLTNDGADGTSTYVENDEIGTAAASNVGDFATAAQGALADTATQPGDLATVATTGDYNDLINPPVLGDSNTTEYTEAAVEPVVGEPISDAFVAANPNKLLFFHDTDNAQTWFFERDDEGSGVWETLIYQPDPEVALQNTYITQTGGTFQFQPIYAELDSVSYQNAADLTINFNGLFTNNTDRRHNYIINESDNVIDFTSTANEFIVPAGKLPQITGKGVVRFFQYSEGATSVIVLSGDLDDAAASGVSSVSSGQGITVDNTDSANPIVNLGGTVQLGSMGDPDELDLTFQFTAWNVLLGLESGFQISDDVGTNTYLQIDNSNNNILVSPAATNANIDLAGAKALTTREWVLANAAGIGGSIGENQIAFGDDQGDITGIAGLEYNGTSFLAPGLRVDPTFTNFDGRLATGGTPSFGATRLGDSDLQTNSLDIGSTLNFVLNDGSQTTQWASFANSVGNTLTWRHTQNPTALFSIQNDAAAATRGVTDVESTIGLVTQYDNGDSFVFDLFNQEYVANATALAQAQGVNMIAPTGDHRKFGIYRSETGLTNITTMMEIDGVDLASQVATFSIPTVVPDDAYAASWDGNFEVPTKNAVYDRIEAIVGGGGGDLLAANNLSDVADAATSLANLNGVTTNTSQTITGQKTYSSTQTFNFITNFRSGFPQFERMDLFPHTPPGTTPTVNAYFGLDASNRLYWKNIGSNSIATFNSNAITADREYALPDNGGTLALLSDIPAGGGDLLAANNLSDVADAATSLANLNGVTTNTTQTITGSKTFSTTARFQGFILADGGFELDATNANLNVFSVYANAQVPTGTANGGAAGQFLMNGNDNWTFLSSSSGSAGFTLNNDNLTTLRTFDLPDSDGTLALTSDIPSTTDFVTLAGSQTITGTKTFTGIINTFDNLLTVTSHIALTATGGFAQSGKILFAPITTPTGTSTGISESQIFAGTNGEMVWLGSGNPAAIFDNTSITTARTYTLPDASGTVALDSTVVDLTSDQTVAGDKVFSGVVSNASAALTSTANSIAWTGQESNLLKIALGENSTLENPSSPVTDAVYQFIITQDATGGRTLAFGTNFLFSGGTAPDFSGAAANSKHLLTGIYDGTDILITAIQDF